MITMNIQELIQKRRALKAKKPHFLRQDSHKKKKLGRQNKWVKPKGLHSKMRLGRRGKRASVKIGWGANKLVRGLHKSGLSITRVSCVADLKKIDPKKQGALIASIGAKKKVAIINECQKVGIKVLNVGDTAKFLAKIDEGMKLRKQNRKSINAKKSESKKKLEENASQKQKEKKDLQESMSDEEKKKQEKKEMDKALASGEY